MQPEKIKRLLGSELAQHDRGFLRYAIKKSGLLDLLRNPENRFQIINAARGSGKSGLLLCHKNDIEENFGQKHLVICKYHADAPLPENFNDFHSSLNFWKNTILGWLVSEIGASSELPIDKDEVAAVNYAERIGRKEIDSVLAKLRVDALPNDKLTYAHDLDESYISRLVAKSNRTFWLLLDEMDDYYENVPKFNQRLIGLLKAGRYIAGLHENIRVRITIRPHIMTTLMRTADVGSTFRSEIVDLAWSGSELLKLLARRVEVFDGVVASQFDLFDSAVSNRETESEQTERTLSRYFEPFDASFVEGKDTGFRGLLTFSLYRPRWMIEFCSLALAYAEGDRAGLAEFKKAASDFGRNRTIFLAGEHKHHFPDLEQVVNQLGSIRKVRLGSAAELKDTIIALIFRTGIRNVRKEGMDEEAISSLESNAALKVAQDLFMIEFIRAAQRVGGKDNHRFYTYPERPSLLSSWNSDPTILWELHPIFARSLNIIDSETYHAHGKYNLFGESRKRRRS